MDKTKSEREFGAHLEKTLGKSLQSENKIIIWGHKHALIIKDGELFNNIAKAFNINKINKTHSFYYNVNWNYNDWTISIDPDLEKEFKEKYGGNYTFN
ncbi:MAG: hypothetical protein KKB62_03570 [Nanoarchaeota archaeon]|nr:hypothetical protein [Nanoarchaeota archaeon]